MMFRLIVLFIAFLKLLVLGKWYPPAHVRDVSATEFANLADLVEQIKAHLVETSRQSEATRKKVYREEVKGNGDEKVELPPAAPVVPREDPFAGLQSGDEVPTSLL